MKTMCELWRSRTVRLPFASTVVGKKPIWEIEMASKHCDNNFPQSDASKRGIPSGKWHKEL